MAHTYTRLLYHIVFGTHNRKHLLARNNRPRIFDYLGGAIRDEGGTPIAINGVDDHVHILAGRRQDKALSSVVGQMKANSSRWIKETFPGMNAFAWQEGSGLFTVSQSRVEDVRAYIENQEPHHNRMPFEEEFKRILRAHGIEFEERYLWT